MPATKTIITLDEFLALPDDGVERWVKDGILYESQSGADMSRRSREHCNAMGRVAQILNNWNDEQSPPRGKVYPGDAGVVLKNGELVTYGIDVAWLDAARLAQQSDEATTIINGAPNLAVEILSPSNLHGELTDKIRALLEYGTQEVWVLDTYWKVVDVYKTGSPKECYQNDRRLQSPILTGFSVPAAKFFD